MLRSYFSVPAHDAERRSDMPEIYTTPPPCLQDVANESHEKLIAGMRWAVLMMLDA